MENNFYMELNEGSNGREFSFYNYNEFTPVHRMKRINDLKTEFDKSIYSSECLNFSFFEIDYEEKKKSFTKLIENSEKDELSKVNKIQQEQNTEEFKGKIDNKDNIGVGIFSNILSNEIQSKNNFMNLFIDKEKDKGKINQESESLSKINQIKALSLENNNKIFHDISNKNQSKFLSETKQLVDQTMELINVKKQQDPVKIEKSEEIKINPLQKLQISSDNYHQLREKIVSVSEDPINKRLSDKITTEINVVISQLSQLDDILKDVDVIANILIQLKNKKKFDLFLFSIDMLLKRLIYKSEKYKSEAKKNYMIFGNFIFELNKKIGENIVNDFFMQIILFKCPYLAFKEFERSNFIDEKQYRKRLGFAGDNETMSEFLSNIESYSYLFFAFIYYNIRFAFNNSNNTKYRIYFENIKDYIENYVTILEKCENSKIKYPVVTAYKVFLNSLGNEIAKHFQNMSERLIKISQKIIKIMEEQKKKPNVTSEIKSLISDNLHFIKVYTKDIKDKKPTDMFK